MRTVASQGKAGISAMGSPHSATPMPNHRASRCDPTSRDATREPITAPAPTAAVRVPTPGSPVRSRSSATTTVKTVSAPRVNAGPCRGRRRAPSRGSARWRGYPPPHQPPDGLLLAPQVWAGRHRRNRSSKAAAASDAADATAKTTSTSVNFRSTAASNGPTSVATESKNPRTTFALASSCPVRHSDGSNRAPVPEGDDSQCHGERPLSSPSSEEAQLSAAQIAVHSIAGEGGCGNVQPVAHRLIHLR